MRISIRFFARFQAVFAMDKLDMELPQGANVRDLLDRLCDTEDKSNAMYSEKGRRLRKDVMITKNQQIVFYLQRLDTVLEEGDQVTIRYAACMG